MTHDAFCLVAGGGPVGMVLAAELGRRGAPCIIVNDAPSTPTHPKSNAISARSMEIFRRLGLAEELRRLGLPPSYPTDVCYVTRLDGDEIARLSMPSSAQAIAHARAGAGAHARPEPPHRLSQIYLEAALKQHIESCAQVDVRFGWRLDEWRQSDHGVEARICNTRDGGTQTLHADYLVGADGARSDVRKGLSVDLEGEAGVVRRFMGGAMASIYVRLPGGASRFAIAPAWQYWIFDPGNRALLVSIDGGDLFCLHAKLDNGGATSAEEIEGFVNRTFGADSGAEIISSAPWTAGYALLAQSYRAERIFLAGDAAHLFTPTGGLGMNTGIEDAIDLGWKLAAVYHRWAPERLLHTYEADRKRAAARNLRFSRAMAQSIGGLHLDDIGDRGAVAALRPKLLRHARSEFIIPGVVFGARKERSALVCAEDGAAPTDSRNRYTPTARPGGYAPHVWLRPGWSVLDEFGVDFTLLCFDDAPGAAEIMAAAERAEAPLKIVDIRNNSAARVLYERRLVLIAPDGYVLWRGDAAPADTDALLSRVRGGDAQPPPRRKPAKPRSARDS